VGERGDRGNGCTLFGAELGQRLMSQTLTVLVEGPHFSRPPGRAVYMST